MNSYSEMTLSDLEFMYDQTSQRFVDTFVNDVYSSFMTDFMTEYGVEEEVMDIRLKYDPEEELLPERAGMAHFDVPEDHDQENFIVIGPPENMEKGFGERLLTAGLGEEYLHEHFDLDDNLTAQESEEVEETIGRIWQLHCHDRIGDYEFQDDYLRRQQAYWNRQRGGSGDRIRELSEFLLGEFDNRNVNEKEVMNRIISNPQPLTRVYVQKF